MTWRFSRSHVSSDQECSRKMFYNYYFAGSGIEKRGLNLEAETGILAHNILALVLKNELLDDAITLCKSEYFEKVRARGFDFPLDEDKLEFEMFRQAALAEALVRAWCKVRLPYYLENGTIVSVEKEHNVSLSTSNCNKCEHTYDSHKYGYCVGLRQIKGVGDIPCECDSYGSDIELMTRIDATWRRNDGALFAGPEFKTVGFINQQKIESWRYSSQVLTHLKGAESLLGEHVTGVKMEFLYKGTKRNDPASGETTYYSPLLRGALKIGSEPYEFAFSSDAARKKGWRAYEAWRELTVEAWIDILPGPVLEAQLFNVDVLKDDNVAERWMRQQRQRQRKIRNGIEALQKSDYIDIAEEVLTETFPARLDSWCYSNQYFKKCPYLGLCYNEVVGDPLENGYVKREPHHEGEFEV
jgi:hypothetical protein